MRLDIPAAVRFISAEPLLGSLFESGPRKQPLDLTPAQARSALAHLMAMPGVAAFAADTAVGLRDLAATLPRLLPADPNWRATASHNSERAGNGLTLAAWTTGAPQEPGMWYQVELPQPAMVTEIHFASRQTYGSIRVHAELKLGQVPAAHGRASAPTASPSPSTRMSPGTTSAASMLRSIPSRITVE